MFRSALAPNILVDFVLPMLSEKVAYGEEV